VITALDRQMDENILGRFDAWVRDHRTLGVPDTLRASMRTQLETILRANQNANVQAAVPAMVTAFETYLTGLTAQGITEAKRTEILNFLRDEILVRQSHLISRLANSSVRKHHADERLALARIRRDEARNSYFYALGLAPGTTFNLDYATLQPVLGVDQSALDREIREQMATLTPNAELEAARAGLLVAGLHDDGVLVSARQLSTHFIMLEMMFTDDGQNLLRRRQSLHSFIGMLEQRARTEKVHKLLGQLTSFQPLDIILQTGAIPRSQDQTPMTGAMCFHMML